MLRKIILILGVLWMVVGPVQAGPSLLFDANTGDVLAADRAGEPWYPASLTKLMTAYVVFHKLRSGQLTLGQKIPVTPLAASQEPSKIGLKPGSTVSVDFALQSLLVYSANDMAYVLAEGAGGTLHDFVGEMNKAAKTLGLTTTHFVNPNGLFDPRHVTSARDMGLIASALIKEFPEYNQYFSQSYVSLGKAKLMNRNSLLRMMPEADGMKTGFVCNSGFNLVASASHEGRRLIAIVFGAANGKERADMARSMLEAGFKMTPSLTYPKLANLNDDALGSIVPADLSPFVCKRKIPVTLVSAQGLGGWGISFGVYDTAEKADMALRGRMISPIGIDMPGRAGIVHLPNTTAYEAVVWNLQQPESVALCAAYQAQNAVCVIKPPQDFTQLALAAAADVVPVKQAPAVVQKKSSRKKNSTSTKRVKKVFH